MDPRTEFRFSHCPVSSCFGHQIHILLSALFALFWAHSCFEFLLSLTIFCLQQKALEAAMNDINGSFGKGSVTRLGSAGGALVWESLSLLILFLDTWLNNKSYKTSWFLHVIFNFRKIKNDLLYCRETFPSGVLTLDLDLGGGLPKGRIVEVCTFCEREKTNKKCDTMIIGFVT